MIKMMDNFLPHTFFEDMKAQYPLLKGGLISALPTTFFGGFFVSGRNPRWKLKPHGTTHSDCFNVRTIYRNRGRNRAHNLHYNGHRSYRGGCWNLTNGFFLGWSLTATGTFTRSVAVLVQGTIRAMLTMIGMLFGFQSPYLHRDLTL